MAEDSSGQEKKGLKWWKYIFFIFPLAVIAAIVLAPFHPSHGLFRQYLSTLVSWPAVILALGLILLIKYREDISFCLKKLIVKTPTGYEIRVAQAETKPPDERARISEYKAKGDATKEDLLNLASATIGYEWSIRYMFRTQYRLLKEIEKYTFVGLTLAALLYSEYLTLGGSKNYDLGAYIGWLSSTVGYIAPKIEGTDTRYILTERGASFLKYCARMNYTEIEFRPL